jgi:regulator of sigma E protease
MPLVFIVGMAVPAYLDNAPVAGWVEPGSPADNVGVVPGDLILGVEGEETATWEQFFEKASQAGEKKFEIQVRGLTGVRSVTLDLAQAEDGRIGLQPPMEPTIGALSPGYPAQKAGVEKGDRILSLGQIPVNHWSEMAIR